MGEITLQDLERRGDERAPGRDVIPYIAATDAGTFTL